MKLIIATHNKGKLLEIKEILSEKFDEIISLYDLKDHEDIVETGESFKENAAIKALHVSKKYNTLALADDSGICVAALNNAPGIYSARYSGKGDEQNNLKLLEELKNEKNRDAYFIAVLALANPNGEIQYFEGKWDGKIALEPKGTNGFGYNPIFIPNGFNTTVAQMSTELKNKLSHRAKALKLLKESL